MEVNQQRAEAAKACFEFNPTFDKVHVTSDCKCFQHQNDAVGHARTLTDKTIDVFERDGDDVEFDEDSADDLSDEAENIPDHLVASIKRQTGNLDTKFQKIEKPAPDEPVVTDTPVISTDILPVTGSPAKNSAVVIEPAGDTQSGTEAEPHKSAIIETINHVIDSVEHVLGADANPDQNTQQ
ncbi:hypothetical protein [Mucilaginibacter lappiensis]|uniref:Uncharacterized protein n=1 Tax=Mucilaginibacter lappiensis TaxID=354630 RepID=A0A841JLJ8_9SPHI|nr:hypothetical protein [Mucilaginibacter lappiensis]MBB6131334.1 hypothetical protein [Mucilaginibacter lappiensis]